MLNAIFRAGLVILPNIIWGLKSSVSILKPVTLLGVLKKDRNETWRLALKELMPGEVRRDRWAIHTGSPVPAGSTGAAAEDRPGAGRGTALSDQVTKHTLPWWPLCWVMGMGCMGGGGGGQCEKSLAPQQTGWLPNPPWALWNLRDLSGCENSS